VDGFGFESHFTAATPPLTAKTIIERFTALGVSAQITEYDQATTDPILQADFMADFLTMAFSLPGVNSFVLWGFWDPKSWILNGPLYTATWELKPSGEAWKGLVFGKWWTNTSAATNASGAATVNGFLGRYALTATGGGITKTYYANLARPAGATLDLKVSGTTGSTKVWLHEADQGVVYAPFVLAADATAYGGYAVTSPAGSGNASNPTTGSIRIDTEAAGTVNIWLRVKAPSSSSDAFWLSLNGEPYQNFTLTQGASWHWVLWKQATLATGTSHSIYVANSEGGTSLSQILIADDLSFTP
jgi:hypothetical protein